MPSGERGILRVLFVEDSEDDAQLLQRQLTRAGYRVDGRRVDTRVDFEAALDAGSWDAVISDHSMPAFTSTEALEALLARQVDIPFILVSGSIGEEAAVAAMKAGAHDYVLKNNPARLVPALERELREAESRRLRQAAEAGRKSVELQLQRAQKMEAIGRLASGIAHDFNNVLTAIRGFTQLAMDRLEEGTTNVRFELDQVRMASDRATRLARQLLAFSRQQVLAPRHIDPTEIIEPMVPMFRQLVGEDIEVRTSLTPQSGSCRVDPGQLEQVVMNLVVNARDAMPKGGRLLVSTYTTEVGDATAARLEVPSGSYNVIEVSDTGHGIDAATRVHLFEPFFTTKPPGQGTGLGLSTAFGIVRQSGGAIDVESEVAEGSTFRVYLPIVTAPAESRPAAKPTRRSPDAVTGTILIVEDDDAVRALVRTVLTGAGYHVLEAGTGTAAAAVVDAVERPLDLLLTDVIMPGMIGPDVARRAKARFPNLRVLFMTAYATHPGIPASFVGDRDALLQKPFHPDQLLAQVHDLLHVAS